MRQPIPKKVMIIIWCLSALSTTLGFFLVEYITNQQQLVATTSSISPRIPHTAYLSFLTSVSATSAIPDGENTLQRQTPPIDQVVFHGSRDKKQIALTFDADMTAAMEEELHRGKVKSFFDPKIIDILTKTKTKATLFLTGMWIETYPDITKKLAATSLFELANHSYSHPSFNGTCYGLAHITDDQDLMQIEKTQRLLKNIAHIDSPFFRFPGGCYSQKNVDVVSKQGLSVIDWDVVGSDAFNNNEKLIVNNVLKNTQNGSIIILHLMGFPNAPKTAIALPQIISTLKSQGFEFVTTSELLGYQKVSKLFDYHDYLN